jgi:hypothetical protein
MRNDLRRRDWRDRCREVRRQLRQYRRGAVGSGGVAQQAMLVIVACPAGMVILRPRGSVV